MVADVRCIVRGGGDLATGVVWRLHRSGTDVIVTELAEPLTIRRTVALSSAVRDGVIAVEGLVGRRCDPDEVEDVLNAGEVPVLVAPVLDDLVRRLAADVVVDARLAKRPLDTRATDADLVVGLGPGLVAGRDCHAVVETNRGHRLGRVIWEGEAERDTGIPGVVAGRGAERVLRAPADGRVEWTVDIGDTVEAGHVLGSVRDTSAAAQVVSPFRGIVRGLIAPGTGVRTGLKIADVDPRQDPSACHEISDKALAVGGGVVEAVGRWRSGR